MKNAQVTTEIFRIIRANQQTPAAEIYAALREHYTAEQINGAMQFIIDDVLIDYNSVAVQNR